ncbi:MAG: class I SAM-dependent methyltransferase, partial [Bryobacteraceae bacterium]
MAAGRQGQTSPRFNMFLRLLHKLVSVGWIYDCSQFLAGAPLVRARLKPLMKDYPSGLLILDVGGGTGFLQRVLPPGCTHICLDLELPKLQRYLYTAAHPLALLADGTMMPLRSRSVDVIACIAVFHHLNEKQLGEMTAESWRALKPGGRLLVLEPLLNRRRWPGRILWSVDRGSCPRTAAQIRELIQGRFTVVH